MVHSTCTIRSTGEQMMTKWYVYGLIMEVVFISLTYIRSALSNKTVFAVDMFHINAYL